MAAHRLRSFLGGRGGIVTALAGLIVVAISCDKMPLVAPTGTAITLISSTNDLPVNGSAEITAVLVQGVQTGGANGASGVTAGGGTAVHNGTVVTFTTTIGRIEPAEAQTSAGKAVVRLIGDGRSGKATITAFSGAASKTLDVNIGSAGASRVVVTANPQSLPAGGGTTSVTARVEDAQGNGLLGVPVSFSTTKGTLSQTTVLTNDQGFAVTQLTTTQEATVSASSGSVTAGSVAITLRAQSSLVITPPATIFVSTPASFSVQAGTSVSGATPIINNMQIDFGDGTPKTAPVTLTGTQAQTFQHLFAQKGQLTVTATGTDQEGTQITNSIQVAVGGITAAATASPSTTIVGATITFNATVGPTNVIIDHYEWDFGDGTGAVTASGQALHSYATSGARTVVVNVVPVAGDSVRVLIPVQIN